MTDQVAEAAPRTHKEAADLAVRHLQAAEKVLHEAYTHPHHSVRLDNVSSQLTNLASVVAHMPEEEESRADYAGRLLELHDSRQLPSADRMPDHANRLLEQELQLRKAV